MDLLYVDLTFADAYGVPPLHLIFLLWVDDYAVSVLHGPEGIIAYDNFHEECAHYIIR